MKTLLKTILQWQHETGGEYARAIDWLTKFAHTVEDGLTVEDDGMNVYITKGDMNKTPVFVSHYDQVHQSIPGFTLVEQGGVVYAMDMDSVQQVGVGGDDKCGMYLCYLALQRMPHCKVVLFADEEAGCAGSSQADMTFFDNASVVIQADRMGGSDAIFHTNGIDIAKPSYILSINDILDTYGYKEAIGTLTDVGELRWNGLKAPAMNLSAGYYRAHTSSEFIILDELHRCCEMALQIALRGSLPEHENDDLPQEDDYWEWEWDEDDYYIPPAGDERCDTCYSVMEWDVLEQQHFCFHCGSYQEPFAQRVYANAD